jgi:hypothetical protein
MDKNKIILPSTIVSPTDIARLVREIETVDDYFRQLEIRGKEKTIPRMSKLLDSTIAANQLSIDDSANREHIVQGLQTVQTSAPIMHISFSVDPPGSHVQSLVTWLRKNIDDNVLVTVGLQPNIGAGCVVRTTNKIFDLSLREYFTSKRDFFTKILHESMQESQSDQANSKNEQVSVISGATT